MMANHVVQAVATHFFGIRTDRLENGSEGAPDLRQQRVQQGRRLWRDPIDRPPHGIVRHSTCPQRLRLLWTPSRIAARYSASSRTWRATAIITGSCPCDAVVRCRGRDHRLPLQPPGPRSRDARTAIIPLYAEVLKIERAHANGRGAVAAGSRALADIVASKKVAYEGLYLLTKALLSDRGRDLRTGRRIGAVLWGYQLAAVTMKAIAIPASGWRCSGSSETARLTRQAKEVCRRIAVGDFEARIFDFRKMTAWPNCSGSSTI